MRRRVFLAILALLPGWARRAPASPPDPYAALEAYVDTLVPEHLGPSASALGADGALRELAGRDAQMGPLIAAGCRWLDERARARGAGSFAALDEGAREAVVGSAARAAPGSGEWVFYQHTRAAVMRHYYADPRGARAVGADGPPQPRGHPDPTEAPR